MISPIIPPNARQSIAYLKPGDKLKHATVVQAAPIIVRRGPAQAAVMHVGLDDGTEYCELPSRGQHPMSALAPLMDGDALPRSGWHTQALLEMEQRAGFKFLSRQPEFIECVAGRPGTLIAAEVGCGKTLFAISLINIHRPKRCLVIAPQGVITAKGDALSQWENEFERFAPWIKPVRVRGVAVGSALSKQVQLTYLQEALSNDGGWLKGVPPDFYDMIIVDEAHLLQNHRTIMAKALFRMQPRWRYALSATPVGNRVEDCLRLCRWLRPDITIELPFHTESGVIGRPVVPASPLLTYRALAHVVAPIRKIDIRPDMPALHVHKIYIDDPVTAAKCAELERTFRPKRGGAGQIERLKLTNLRNICADSKQKAREIAHMLSLNPHAVVASARIKQTDAIIAYLSGAAPFLTVGRIDSTVDPSGNAETSAAFKRGAIDSLFMGIKCAYGYSFPDCDTVHVASQEWSYGSFAQALGRVYRINSQKPVHAYVYLLRGSVEEKIFDTVCAKESAAMAALYGETP